MPIPPAVRAIRAAIAAKDLDAMRHGLALGENYARVVEADVARNKANPPPPPAEGEVRIDGDALLAEVTSALDELRAAIARVEREQREAKRQQM